MKQWDDFVDGFPPIVSDPSVPADEIRFMDAETQRIIGAFKIPEEYLKSPAYVQERAAHELVWSGRMKSSVKTVQTLDMVTATALGGPLKGLLVMPPSDTELPYVVFRTHKGSLAYAWEQAAGRNKTMRWMRDWRSE